MAGERTVTEPRADDGEAQERLELEEVADGSLLAASHLHRYELAADLCAGARVLDLCCGTGYGASILARAAATVHGVDVSEAAIAAARAQVPEEHAGRVSFEVGDALEYLRSVGAGSYDAVVCFEGLEHVPDPDAVLAEIERLATAGARVLLSFPNSLGFEEENAYHVTDYGWEEVQVVAARFPDAVLLGQSLAEGSWIAEIGAADGPVTAWVVGADEARPEWANHWLLVAGVDEEATSRARARMALAVTPPHNAYMRHLERANDELRRTNARLSRAWLGVHDAAAAAVVRRLQEENDAGRERARVAEAEAEKWHAIADNNDWARAQLERRLAEPRYARMDAIRDRVLCVPGARALQRLLR